MSDQAKIVIIDGEEHVETDYSTPLGLGLKVTPNSRLLTADTLAMRKPLAPMSELKNIIQSQDFNFGQAYFDSSYVTFQNGYGSCAGYAVASAGTKARVLNGFPRVDLSGDYQYSRVNGNRDRGSGLQENMESFMKNGCATAKTVPLGGIYRRKYNTAIADAEAQRYRGHELFAIPDEQSLANALAMKMHVIIAIHVTRNWRRFDSDDVLAECNGVGNHCEHLDDIRWSAKHGRFEYRKVTSHGRDYSGDGFCWTAWDLHYATTSRYHVFYALPSMIVDPELDIYNIENDHRQDDPAPLPPADDLSIICYTASSCGWCTKWKNEVAPEAEREGWKITYENASGPVPRFKINVRGNTIDRTGFISWQELRNLNTVR